MIDLPSLVQMVGGVTTILYGVITALAIGFLIFDRKPKEKRAVESKEQPTRRAA